MKKLTGIENRVEELIGRCRASGLRITQQRLEIFRELLNCSDHPDAEKLFQRLRGKMPGLSLDTVYRTLWMLNDAGVITTMGLEREKTRFDGNIDHHHHFVCIKCGSISDFYSDTLDSLEIPESAKKLGKACNAHVEIRGICNNCSKVSDPSEI